jgi:murein DD-endopeptidase MepM/ murein hydrolase activator NlpD
VVPLALVAMIAVGPSARAHQDSNPSPNGVSPWYYSESWAITGSWYGEGYHRDYINGAHYNDHYALDFAVPGAGCNRRLYAMYPSMTVTAVDANNGMMEMQKTIGGVRYRVRYWHMNSFRVGRGAVVGTTTIVGYSGNRGNASGCHLHLSMHRLNSNGSWYSIPPRFCGRTYPHNHSTRFRGC